jgi:hypothetical protein
MHRHPHHARTLTGNIAGNHCRNVLQVNALQLHSPESFQVIKNEILLKLDVCARTLSPWTKWWSFNSVICTWMSSKVCQVNQVQYVNMKDSLLSTIRSENQHYKGILYMLNAGCRKELSTIRNRQSRSSSSLSCDRSIAFPNRVLQRLRSWASSFNCQYQIDSTQKY